MPRSSDRRDRIVEAARRRFTRFGFEATTIGDLATELDISKAAIAYYFPTKDTFLEELVTPFLDALERAVERSEDPRAVLGGYLDMITDHHDIAVWLDTDPTLQRLDDYGGRLRRINDEVVRTLVGRRRSGAARIEAMAALGALWRPARGVSADELTSHREALLDVALGGPTA